MWGGELSPNYRLSAAPTGKRVRLRVFKRGADTYAARRIFIRVLGFWFGSYGHKPLQDRRGEALALDLGFLAAVGER